MQSSWAVGYALAAVVNLLVQDVLGFGWRTVFFVGVLPALYAFWVRRGVEEPALWRAARTRPERVPLRTALAGPMLGVTVAVTLMNACTMFAWWGFNTWVPSYLQLAPEAGGIGLSGAAMNLFIIAMQVGMWFGYVTFGFMADAIGRKRTYVTYLLTAAVLLPLYGILRVPALLLFLGPLVAFFGTGYFSGLGALVAELYPTTVRATAAGFCYNFGRIASAAAPYTVGSVAQSRGFGVAFTIAGAAFLLAALAWNWIPETRNRELT